MKKTGWSSLALLAFKERFKSAACLTDDPTPRPCRSSATCLEQICPSRIASTGVGVRACVPEVSDSQAQAMSSRTGLGNAVDVHEIPSCRSVLKHVSARLAKFKSTVTESKKQSERGTLWFPSLHCVSDVAGWKRRSASFPH